MDTHEDRSLEAGNEKAITAGAQRTGAIAPPLLPSRMRMYTVSGDGDKRLSPHFQVREFACHDGSDALDIDLALVELLELIRAHFGGKPITVVSGYRTRAHNTRVGGASNSQHLYGRAADIKIKGVEPKEIFDALNRFHRGGLGVYDSWVHVDVRPQRARWDERTKR